MTNTNEQFTQKKVNASGVDLYEFSFDKKEKEEQTTRVSFDKSSIDAEIKRLSNIYYREDLLEINRIKHPIVYLGSSKLDNLIFDANLSKFVIPEVLSKFYEGVKAEKVKPKHTDGRRIRIKNYTVVDNYLHLDIQETSYFDFMMTNASQDLSMNKYDSKLSEELTLRKLDLSDSGKINLSNSIMSNMLGLAFIVKINDKNDHPYLFFGKRNAGRTVGAETVSLLGGTPDWEDGYADGSKQLRDVLYKNTVEEMKEELGIPSDEFDVSKLYFCQDFSRAPTMLVELEIGKSQINKKGNIILEDMVDILSSTPSVKEEHSEFYAVPACKKGFKALMDNYNFNFISRAGFQIYLNDKHKYGPISGNPI